MGGSSVFRVKEKDPNVGVIMETLTEYGQTTIMAQEFLPEITRGDKRIIMINAGIRLLALMTRITYLTRRQHNFESISKQFS